MFINKHVSGSIKFFKIDFARLIIINFKINLEQQKYEEIMIHEYLL